MKRFAYLWHDMFASSKRPVPITIISLLYITSAIATTVYTVNKDWLLSIASMVFYLVIGVGLWRMDMWARNAEIGICYIQIMAGIFLAFLLYKTTLFGSAPPFYRGWIYILLGILFTINVLIIYYLKKPEVIQKFKSG